MRNNLVALIFGVLFTAVFAASARTITEDEAHAIGIDAYLHYSPITMDLTRLQSTNVEPGKVAFKGPMNIFVNAQAYPTADMRTVVRPNFDTLYSAAWLDLTKEPMVVSVPDPPISSSRRQAGQTPFPPNSHKSNANALCLDHRPHQDRRAAGLRRGSQDPGRLQDHAAVAMGQTTFAAGGQNRLERGHEDAAEDSSGPHVSRKFFAYVAELLKLHAPHITDEPIIARLKRIFEVGKSFDLEKADPAVKKALETVPEDAQKLMAWKVATLARVVHGWSMNTDTMGVYSNYYLKRAIVTQFGLGANLPEDAIYPLNLGDSEGKPPDGTNNYTIHFEKEQIPPVQAFWSITLYDPEGFSGGKHDRSVCRLELDAAQIQCRRLTRSLLAERESGRRQGGELVACA